MEEWQEWQIRADQIAASLGQETDALQSDFFSDEGEASYRSFWPRFRALKEKVRIAPAIRLEDKLALERRLRDLGARAYKGQEVAYARSEERKTELLASIAEYRAAGAAAESPRELRLIKRDLDAARGQFEGGTPLMPQDRQAVWEAWREATQFIWQRLTSIWDANEAHLREILSDGRQQLESGNANGARQAVSRFYDALKTRESRQNAVRSLRDESAQLRAEANQLEERRAADRVSSQKSQLVSPLDSWKAELERSREAASRASEDVDELERQFRETRSILDQAMMRGNLVDKRRKLSELERTIRSLEQRIDQAEEVPAISAG